MKAIKTIFLSLFTVTVLSIYDLANDPSRVVIEACKSKNECVQIIIPRDDLERPETIDTLAKLLESHL